MPDGRMDRQTDGWTDAQTDHGDFIGPSVGQVSDGWTNRQTDGQKDNTNFIAPSVGRGSNMSNVLLLTGYY